jgi:hypothetical protein
MKMQSTFWIIATVIVLAGAYMALKPKGSGDVTPVVTETRQQVMPPVAAPQGEAPTRLKSPADPTSPVSPTPLQERAVSSNTATTDSAPVTYDVVVRHGRRESGPLIVKAHQGDELVIRITSDEPDEVHLHGYNLHLSLKPGIAGTLRFKANLTGRFTYELHKSDLELGVLEVYPR